MKVRSSRPVPNFHSFTVASQKPEPWNFFTAGLVVAMAVARALDFLSTWIVTPKLELEANSS